MKSNQLFQLFSQNFIEDDQLNYFKSGTGSGGLVNVPYNVSILDALKTTKLKRVYDSFTLFSFFKKLFLKPKKYNSVRTKRTNNKVPKRINRIFLLHATEISSFLSATVTFCSTSFLRYSSKIESFPTLFIFSSIKEIVESISVNWTLLQLYV